MGKLDELEQELLREKEELERKAAVAAGKAAVKTAWRGLVAAVTGAAESVVGAAERELEGARAARGKAPEGGEVRDDAVDGYTASARALENVRGSIGKVETSARQQRLDREARALAELEALKRSRAEAPPVVADEVEVARTFDAPEASGPSGEEDWPERPEEREPAKRTL